MQKRSISLAVAVAASLAASPATRAQEPDTGDLLEESAELDKFVVTADPLGSQAEELPIPVGVLTGEQLYLRNNGGAVGEVLEGQLGVTGSYFGPVSSRPIIRGQQGPRVTVLENRIGSLDVSDLSPDHAVTVDPLIAEQNEVIRGPGTLIYGSGAEGGVVNVVTNRIPKQLPHRTVTGAVEVRGDTAASEEAFAAKADGAFGNVAWHLDYVNRETDDVDIDGYATRTSIRREEAEEGEPVEEEKGTLANSDSDSDAYAAGLSWIGETFTLGASYSKYENNYGLPGSSHEHEHEEGEGHGDEEEEGEGGAKIELDQDRVDLYGEYTGFGGPIKALRFEAGINDYEHTEFEPDGEAGTKFENDAWEGRLELVHTLGEWQGVAGVQVLDRDFKAVGEEAFVPQTDTNSLGLFLLEERRFDDLRFSISARYEALEHDPSGALDEYDENAGSFALGFVWDQGQRLVPSLNLAYTERHPKAEELYSDGPHIATGLFEIGDASLGKEKNKSVDFGVAYRGSRVRWGVSVFYKAAGDYIFLRENGEVEDGLPVAEYVQDDAIFYGYEAEVETHLAKTAYGDLDLRLWTDIVRGELDDSRQGNDDLPRIPPQRFGASLGWLAERWSAGVDWTRYMGQGRVSDFELETGAYTMLDAHLLFGFDLGPGHLDLFIRGTNLLDERGRRHASFLKDYAPIPGQSVHGGVRFHFL